jgi:peroxiredoxin Q/BCP
MPIFSWLISKPLEVGAKAPDFLLSDQDGRSVKLSDFRGKKNVVLIFYPGDDTSTCTKQLCEFRDDYAALSGTDTIVFGVNPQTAESHRRFIAKRDYPFSLLVDTGQSVAQNYHASGLIVKRTVYLVGKSGIVRFAQRGRPSPAVVLETAE